MAFVKDWVKYLTYRHNEKIVAMRPGFVVKLKYNKYRIKIWKCDMLFKQLRKFAFSLKIAENVLNENIFHSKNIFILKYFIC